jgi:Baseplate J-like protein
MASDGADRSGCGCCQGPGPTTPLAVFNRPALSAVAYRVGDYAAFRQAMLQAIPRVGAELAGELGLPASPLAAWTTRRPDDLGIALLELWAVVGDILTFYQERAANEAYLRTAVHRDSVRRLAAMLDYRPHPGVAADTLLAFTLEPDATVQVPVGLRAQSVPGQGQTPQTFETVEAIGADHLLNRVRLFPQPLADNPLATGGASGMLAPTSAVPAPGDRLVLFPDTGKPFAAPEEKTVAGVEEVDGRTVLTWSPAVRHSGWSPTTATPPPPGTTPARLFGYRRTFRMFGADAPTAFLKPIPPAPVTLPSGGTTIPPGTPPIIGWEYLDSTVTGSGYSFDLTLPDVLPLDGLYEDLEPGTEVLVVTPTRALFTSVKKVESLHQEQGPQTATVTVVTLADALLGLNETVDRRQVLVYELTGEIVLRSWAMAAEIVAGTGTVFADAAALPAIDAGRVVLVDDADGRPQAVTVAAAGTRAAAPNDPAAEFLAIPLAPSLSRKLDAATAHLLGNVARATHGETVAGEVVGSGDAAVSFQAFALAKQPLTQVRSAAAPGGAQSTLSLRVDQVEWRKVPSLLGQPPAARVYTTEVRDDGSTGVGFGDGVTGARLPTGRNNLTATYRQGLGAAGNLDPGRITTALDRPTGLEAVTNPVASSGGTDPEPTDLARVNAPNTVRAFDRAISLRDFEDLARGFAGVAKALATSVWDGEVQTVHLTVAGPDGLVLSAEVLDALREYLDLRRDPNRPLLVDSYRPVAVAVQATMQVDPAHVDAVVEAAGRDALAGLLSLEARRFGQPVHLSDVYAALQGPDGVVSVDVNRFGYEDPDMAPAHGVPAAPVLARLPIDPARPNPKPPPRVLAAELAVAGSAAAVVVTASGGLSS